MYVKVVRSTWNTYRGAGEEVIATLGTLEEVSKSLDVLIRGLSGLKNPESYRQIRTSRSGSMPANRARHTTRQRSRKPVKRSEGKK